MPDIEINLTLQLQHAALEAAEDGIVITDNTGLILWVNPAFSRMCGYSREELVGHNPSLLKSGLHDDAFFRRLWETISSGHVWRSEVYNRRKDGTIYPEEETITPVLDTSGQIQNFVAIKRDITRRKRQEHLQHRTQKALLALSSVNAALLYIKDEDALLAEVCRVLTEVAGYQLAWVGFAEHDREKSIRPVAQSGFDDGYLDAVNLTWADIERGHGPGGTAVRSGKPCVIQDIINDTRFLPWREQAQKRGFKSVIGLPLKDGEHPFGVLLIYAAAADAFDSEEMRLLIEMADDLAFGIRSIRSEKEREQIQRQLQQAQKMEAIGHLTSGIAHDFNNMLTSILGYAELSLEEVVGRGDSLLLGYLQQIHHAGDHAKKLAAQLLAFSRSKDDELSPTDLKSIIKGTQGILAPVLPAGIRVSSHFEDGLPAVNTDPVLVQQIIMNLCINARDAMGTQGQLDIGLRLSPNDAHVCSSCHQHFSGEMVELYVADTGCGIGEEGRDKIFDPFYTTKTADKGTGMGLSTVHGIVHKHGGHMVVESDIGTGSVFRIFLPPSPYTPDEEAQSSFSSGMLKQYTLTGRVLIVDDEFSIAALIGELLKSCGCEAVIETRSDDALERFVSRPEEFELVILEQHMPDMAGLELAEVMLQRGSELPIILCSASASEEERAQAKALGVAAFLQKPIDSRVLLETVARLLG